MITTKAQKWGNSIAIRLPKSLVDRYNIRAGSGLVFYAKENEITIRPSVVEVPSLEELMKGITKKNCHKYVEIGIRGKELWW